MSADHRLGFNTMYEAVAAGQTTQTIGVSGAIGDLLERVIVTVVTSGATGTVAIKDGADTAITIVAASTPIGCYSIDIGARSKTGAWQITTGAGATAIAVGRFS